jgi:tRNA threonylcarbamoyladenosine biosynthesis protein TsaE
VHVDAYRLGGLEELDDLDLDTSLEDAVTVVEWGGGLAEQLSEDRLEVVLDRSESSDPDDQQRVARLLPHGPRWAAEEVRRALGAPVG